MAISVGPAWVKNAAKSAVKTAAMLCAAALLSGCLQSELTSPPPTAQDVHAKRAELDKARAELGEARRRADATAVAIEKTAKEEAEVDAKLAALNRQLLAFEQERAALSVLEREERATSAQRARVERLEREIKVLKGLISDTSP